AGVVDERVDRDTCGGKLLCNLHGRFGVRQVFGDHAYADPERCDQVTAELIELLSVARHEDEIVAVLREELDQLPADAARRAGDKRGAHVGSLRSEEKRFLLGSGSRRDQVSRSNRAKRLAPREAERRVGTRETVEAVLPSREPVAEPGPDASEADVFGGEGRIRTGGRVISPTAV